MKFVTKTTIGAATVFALLAGVSTSYVVNAQDAANDGQAQIQLADNHGGEKKKKGRGRHMLRQLDADNSGSISLEEFTNGTNKQLAELDADGDGTVTDAEFEAHKEARKAERDGKRKEHSAERQQKRKERMMERVDANDDGKITVEELKTSRMDMFEKLDANDDGELTRDEMRKARKMMRRG